MAENRMSIFAATPVLKPGQSEAERRRTAKGKWVPIELQTKRFKLRQKNVTEPDQFGNQAAKEDRYFSNSRHLMSLFSDGSPMVTNKGTQLSTDLLSPSEDGSDRNTLEHYVQVLKELSDREAKGTLHDEDKAFLAALRDWARRRTGS